MEHFASVPELSSILHCQGLDESHSPDQLSSYYNAPAVEPLMGAPCSWQHSGLDLNNQEHKPDSQSADSTQGLLEAIYLSTPWFSVARGHSEPCEHRCFVCEPPVASLADGLDYRPRANPYHPYDRRLKNPHRKRMPAAQFESDPSKLQERCSRDGGDPDAISLISRIFSEGVTLSALTRQKTAEEVTSQAFGRGPGQVYLVLLETIQTGDSNIGFRYRCRLCPDYAKAASWKHERDVLRHLRKHHFGLAKECKQCGKRVYTTSEMRTHRCPLTKHFSHF